ncbi:MAG: flagellar export chaperone FliS [Armatimonadia bacterium]|nr:flagellar export chaperone FliS [Armatimonadia bacterium]
MSAKRAYSKYRNATVETASPGKLVLMLYDGALRFLNQAVKHLEEESPKEAHFAIVRAEDIVCELMSSLDMDQGGQISKNLLALYEFMYVHLVEANLHKDVGKVQEVMSLITDLRDAWAQAIEIHAQEEFRAKQSTLPQAQRTPDLSEVAPSKKAVDAKAKQQPKPRDDEDAPEPGGFSIVS